jgi:hypothetical protein
MIMVGTPYLVLPFNNFEFFFVPIKNSSSEKRPLLQDQGLPCALMHASAARSRVLETPHIKSKRLCSYAFFCTCTYASAPRSRVLASISFEMMIAASAIQFIQHLNEKLLAYNLDSLRVQKFEGHLKPANFTISTSETPKSAGL